MSVCLQVSDFYKCLFVLCPYTRYTVQGSSRNIELSSLVTLLHLHYNLRLIEFCFNATFYNMQGVLVWLGRHGLRNCSTALFAPQTYRYRALFNQPILLKYTASYIPQSSCIASSRAAFNLLAGGGNDLTERANLIFACRAERIKSCACRARWYVLARSML